MNLRVVARTADVLAECPVWNANTGELYWVDIERGLLHATDAFGANHRSIRFPERIGSFAFCAGGGFVVALEHSLSLCDKAGGALRQVFANPAPRGTTRFNDGKCDPGGRFWSGTLDLAFRRPLGALYCLDADLSARLVVPGVCISNGLAWSPDATRMYFADSYARRVDCYDFDAATGIPSGRRTFADTSALAGNPDGATVSADGRYWLAMYNGGCVLVFAADGALLERITLPVRRPTCCAFGGSDLRTLFITCAADDPGMRDPAFDGVSVFALDVQAEGLPATLFRERLPAATGGTAR
jgi:sugar lactone lactonase YvrE